MKIWHGLFFILISVCYYLVFPQEGAMAAVYGLLTTLCVAVVREVIKTNL